MDLNEPLPRRRFVMRANRLMSCGICDVPIEPDDEIVVIDDEFCHLNCAHDDD